MRDVSHALSRFPCVRLVSGVSFSCPLVGVLHFFYRVTFCYDFTPRVFFYVFTVLHDTFFTSCLDE